MTPARRLTQTLASLCLGLSIWAGLTASARADPGYPDPSFGHRGVVKLNVEPSGDVIGADIAGDRQRGFAVVTRSTDEHSVLVRLLPDGSVDRGFGEAGVMPLPGGPWEAIDMAADGAIVVVGAKDGDLAIARYTSSGHPDPSFGNGSGEETLHAQPQPIDPYFRDLDQPREIFADVVVEPDGRILAAGNLRLEKTEAAEEERPSISAGTVVARFQPDGSLDTSFGDAGMLNPTSASAGRLVTVNRLTLQADGRVLLAGNVVRNLAVLRLTSNGTLDPAFGHGGAVVSKADTFNSGEGFGQIGDAKAVLVRPDGRLVVVGQTTLLGLLPDGSRDQGFGAHGRVFTEDLYGEKIWASSAALDGKGRILIAGDDGGGGTVGRFLPNGHRDRRFGGDGVAETNVTHGEFAERETDESETAILTTADGATVTAGFAFAGSHGELAAIARTGGDGQLAYCHGKVATMQGTPGPDHIHGYGVIVAKGGDDEIRSSGGTICAGSGDDVIYDQGGDIYAGAGDDRVREDLGGTIRGGPGEDVLESHSDVANILYGGSGADRLDAKGGRDRLFGGPGADVLLGGGGADLLLGGPGDDLLLGGSGADRLDGGPGSNRLRDGASGPARTIYEVRRPGFRIRLRVQGHLIAGIHLAALLHCRNGSRGGTEYNSDQVKLRIHANGRFREKTYNDYEVGYEESLLAGTVQADRITGIYRNLDSEQTTCTTGKPGHPLIHFTARRKP